MTKETKEQLDCGCVVQREKIIQLCFNHESAWAAKKYPESMGSFDDIENWWEKFDED